MALEIERKFLVTGDGWKPLAVRRRRLRQAYLRRDGRLSIRIRIDGDRAAYLTIKSAETSRSRNEYEYTIPLRDAEELAAFRDGALVVKTRHNVPFAGLEWEVDEFEADNAGLVLAEVELGDSAQAIDLPPWIGPEVTHDPRYYNAALAGRPWSTWPDNGGYGANPE